MSRVLAGVSGIRRGVALSAGLVMAGGLAVFATGAGAAPQPTVSQVQAKINQLTSQFDKVSEQLDQAGQQLSAAQTKLSQVRVRLKNANTQFQTAQANVAANAAAAFEDTGATSIAGVLTSGDPSVVLQQGSLLMELSGNRSAQTKQLLTDASQLAGVEQEMSRTEAGIAGLKQPAVRPQVLAGQAHRHAEGHAGQPDRAAAAGRAEQLDRRGRHGHDLGHLQRNDLDPGRQGRRLRLRPAGQAVPVGRDRTGQLSTAPAWSRPPGPRPGSASRAPPTRSGPPCRTSPPPRSSPATCCTSTEWGTWPSTWAAATSSTPRRPGWMCRRSPWRLVQVHLGRRGPPVDSGRPVARIPV